MKAQRRPARPRVSNPDQAVIERVIPDDLRRGLEALGLALAGDARAWWSLPSARVTGTVAAVARLAAVLDGDVVWASVLLDVEPGTYRRAVERALAAWRRDKMSVREPPRFPRLAA